MFKYLKDFSQENCSIARWIRSTFARCISHAHKEADRIHFRLTFACIH